MSSSNVHPYLNRNNVGFDIQHHDSSDTPLANIPEFVKKLFCMLEQDTRADILTWGAHGKSFVVVDPNEFARLILPKHFKHCNFASFVRQLNKYDFHKVRNPEDGSRPYGEQAWEFQHPHFQYDRQDLLDGIKRKASTKTGASAARPSEYSSMNDHGKPSVKQQQSKNQSTKGKSHHGAWEDEMKSIMFQLQSQVKQLQEQHTTSTTHMQGLGYNYNKISDTLFGLKDTLALQDQLMKQLVQVATTTTRTTQDARTNTNVQQQQWAHSYNQLAHQTNQHVEQITQHVGSLQYELSLSDLLPSYDNHSTPAQAGVTMTTMLPPSSSSPSTSSSSSLSPSTQSSPKTELAVAELRVTDPTFKSCDGAPITSSPPTITHDKSHTTSTSRQMMLTLNPTTTRKRSRSFVPPGWSVPPRVLLVDDDSIFRRLSTRLLEMAGCTIEVAVDGVEAIDKLGTDHYDIVLMDIMMPNLDGISATRNIRQYDTWTPIISMTANTTDRDVREYIMSGMTDVLPKPLDQSTLCKLLERYCAHLKLMQRRQIPRTIEQSSSDNSTTASLLVAARSSSGDNNDPLERENNNNNEQQSVTTWVEMNPEDFASILPQQQQQQQQISSSSCSTRRSTTTMDHHHYHTSSSVASSSTSSTSSSSSSSLSVADLHPIWGNTFAYNIPTCTFMLNQEISNATTTTSPSTTTTIKQELEEEETDKNVDINQAPACKKLKSSSWQ